MKSLCVMLLAAISLLAADVTGKWSGKILAKTPEGEQELTAYVVLTQDGNKVTGTAGPDAGEQYPIENGKIQDGKLTFQVSAGGGTLSFAVKPDGDRMSGDAKLERDGQTMTGVLSIARIK
jgi:hypothetical protein